MKKDRSKNKTASKKKIEKERSDRDAKGSVEDYKKQLAELRSQITKLGEIIDKVEDEKYLIEMNLKRALADYDNLEKNQAKRLDIAMTQMTGKLSEQVISVIENLKIAEKISKDLEMSEEVKAWKEGILSVKTQLENILADYGVNSMNVSEGDDFDSNNHEALTTVDNPDMRGKVTEVISDGYMIGDTVVKSAKVIVGK